MERFDFSTGHIFIKAGNWSIFLNGSGNCGQSGSRELAIKDILSHWKISGKLKTEIENIFNNKLVVSASAGDQLELF